MFSLKLLQFFSSVLNYATDRICILSISILYSMVYFEQGSFKIFELLVSCVLIGKKYC